MKRLLATLRARLILLILSTALPALGLILYTGLEERRHAVWMAHQDALHQARHFAAEHGRVVEGAGQFLAALARLPDLREGSPEACGRLLGEIRGLFSQYALLGVARPDGSVACSDPATPVRLSLAGWPFFRQAVGAGGFSVGEYREGDLGPSKGLPLGLAVRDPAGRPRSVLFAILDAAWVSRLAEDGRLPLGGHLTVADREGRILLRHPGGESWVGRMLPGAPLIRLARTTRGEQQGEVDGLDGRPQLVATAPLAGLGGGETDVLVEIPLGTAHAGANRLLVRNLASLLLVALAVGLIGWMGSTRSLLRPMRSLMQAAERLRAGDLAARASLAAGPREIRELGVSFDAMADALEGELAARRKAEAAARARSEALTALLRGAQSVVAGLGLESTLQRIVQEASDFAGTRHVKILLVDEAGEMLRLGAIAGASAPPDFRVPLGTSYSGTVATTGEPLFVPDTQSDPRNLLRDRDREQGIRTYLGLPIRGPEGVLGVLTFNTEVPCTYSPEELDHLRTFAAHAAVAIENARLYEQVRAHAWELELTVTERTAALEQANRKLAAASRAKSEFLANMSHELRTPLNGILGFTQLLQEQNGSLPEEKRSRYLGHIASSGRHLLSLISDILDLSKIEAGKIELNPVPLPVAQTLEDLLVIARGLANPKGQRIELAVAPDLPALTADPVRFKQILFNLLSNAVKFTPAGGLVRLTARVIAELPSEAAAGRQQPAEGERELPRLQSEIANRKSEMIELVVSDTGAGIRAEDLPRLFQEFTQLESTAAHHQEGTGLGLALTRRLVELHGGWIWAESAGLGQGSTFTLVLPLEGAGHGQTD